MTTQVLLGLVGTAGAVTGAVITAWVARRQASAQERQAELLEKQMEAQAKRQRPGVTIQQAVKLSSSAYSVRLQAVREGAQHIEVWIADAHKYTAAVTKYAHVGSLGRGEEKRVTLDAVSEADEARELSVWWQAKEVEPQRSLARIEADSPAEADEPASATGADTPTTMPDRQAVGSERAVTVRNYAFVYDLTADDVRFGRSHTDILEGLPEALEMRPHQPGRFIMGRVSIDVSESFGVGGISERELALLALRVTRDGFSPPDPQFERD